MAKAGSLRPFVFHGALHCERSHTAFADSDDPDTPGVAAPATVNAATAALQNAGKEVATEYNP